MKNFVIIVAAGSGTRSGSEIPKQYVKVAGKSILEHTISVFEQSDKIDGIILVVNADHINFYKDTKSTKQIFFVIGGKTRQESVRNGLEFLSATNPDNVLIHDAARPFVKLQEVEEILKNLGFSSAVELVTYCADTAEYNGAYIDRNNLKFAQTPQGFNFKTILELHRNSSNLNATDENLNATDDISLAKTNGLKVSTIIGDKSNFKITTNDDLNLAKKIINSNYMIRTGFGYDVHQIELENNSKIFLGGISIDSEYKIIAHSDGDVVIHAIVDAILGALSLGDIGHYFPPSEQKWKGVQSSVFLSKCTELLKENHASINNIDVSIVAESPKIKPHIDSMKLRLAEILEISQNQIGIKATTSEKLGFIGRKEGVAAHAVATISVKQGY